MSVSDTFFAEKNTWGSSAKHFLSNKKETTDFTVYLRNSTNPIVSLTLRQAIRFSFSIADQQLCKLLLAICPFRQPNIIITASHFICQPLPGKSSRQTHEHITVHAYVSSNGICRGFAFQYGNFLLPPRFLRHFRFQKCLPVNRNMSIQNVYVLQKTSYLRAVAAIPLCISEKSRNAARSTTTTLAPAGVEYV